MVRTQIGRDGQWVTLPNWALTAIGVVLMTIGGTLCTNLGRTLEAHDAKLSAHSDRLAAHSQSVATLDLRVANVEAAQPRTNDKLDRILVLLERSLRVDATPPR